MMIYFFSLAGLLAKLFVDENAFSQLFLSFLLTGYTVDDAVVWLPSMVVWKPSAWKV